MFDTAIIDYETSNLKSVISACKIVGIKYVITNDQKIIRNCKSLIIPGVGSFQSAMKFIKKKKLEKIIKEFVFLNKPVLGICLGMHIFFQSSEESPKIKGLNLIKSKVKKFDSYKSENIPYIGWNKIFSNKKNILLPKTKSLYYFVHSYYVDFFKKKDFNISFSFNGKIKFCSSIKFKNLFLIQFHPEKSGKKGLLVYKNFKKLISNQN